MWTKATRFPGYHRVRWKDKARGKVERGPGAARHRAWGEEFDDK